MVSSCLNLATSLPSDSPQEGPQEGPQSHETKGTIGVRRAICTYSGRHGIGVEERTVEDCTLMRTDTASPKLPAELYCVHEIPNINIGNS